MRILKATDIFPKIYSISNGEIIKESNGQFYNRQTAEHILENNILPNDSEMKRILENDEEQLSNKAVKYFRSKYITLLPLETEKLNLLLKPIKRFEIFTLDVFGGKVFLTEDVNLPDGKDGELYYSFKIANEIYQKIIDIQDSSINNYEEIKYLYDKEILNIESEILKLRITDSENFKKDVNVYNLISRTPIYENYQLLNEDKEYLLKKNKELTTIISEYNKKIGELTIKLQISLEKIESMKKPKTFIEKLKYLFKNEKQYILLDSYKKE